MQSSVQKNFMALNEFYEILDFFDEYGNCYLMQQDMEFEMVAGQAPLTSDGSIVVTEEEVKELTQECIGKSGSNSVAFRFENRQTEQVVIWGVL